MTKSEYLSNSGKLLLICSAQLFFANLIVFLGANSESLAFYGGKLSNFTFYLTLLLGFLAFNGEGIGYKRSRSFKSKKVTTFLKVLLFFAFFIRYIKKPIEYLVLSVCGEKLLGALARVFLGLFNTSASYGFLLTAVAFWYIFRDKSASAGVRISEYCAFGVGVLYNLYKIFNYAVEKYQLTYFGEGFVTFFSQDELLHSLALIQFFVDSVMFLFVIIYYNKFSIAESEAQEKAREKLIFSRKIYNPDCVGIDTLDDDLLLLKESEDQYLENIENE